MTELEHLMLSVCFGSTVGLIVGTWIIIIKDAIIQHRIKKRLSKEVDKQ